MYRPVKTKHDFVTRYIAGEFGNRAPSWNNLREFEAGGYHGLVHLRNRVAGGETYYNLKFKQVVKKWKGLYGPSWYCSAMAPTTKTLFQGEVRRSVTGLEFFYSTHTLPMREALALESHTDYGLRATCLLRTGLNTVSYEWLLELLDRYPGHVIELSAYGVCWGTLPGYNTVFWEVRDY